MFDNYLESIDNINPKYKNFAMDVINYLESSMEKELALYATHGFCTDGGVAGAMIRYAIEGAAIIPLDYWMLNNDLAAPVLSELPWKGIVDLKPFNKNPVDFWVDHHISAMNSKVNAKRIRFDQDGDSGSYQLLESKFIDPLPEKIIELALMTRITDTAGYETEPPVEQIDDISDLSIQSENQDYERRIWLLDDAFGSMETLKHHLQLFNYLAKDGFYGISNVLKRVNAHRSKRKEAYDVADSIGVEADVILFSFKEETQDKFTILRRLQKNGAKVAVSLSITENQGIKISLRRNRHLSSEENDRIQLQEVASKMNGGGHPGAAGAHTADINEAESVINQWAKELDLTSKLVEL